MDTKLTVNADVPLAASTELEGAKDFDSVVQRRQSAQEQIKRLKVAVAECDLVLGDILDTNDVKRVLWHGLEHGMSSDFVVSRREGGERKSIDRVRLLDLGVPASIIEQATRVTKTRPGIVVRSAGDHSGHDDETT